MKVEKVNEQEATLHELSEELYVESPVEEATSYWVSIPITSPLLLFSISQNKK
jgi:hypothetical protein